MTEEWGTGDCQLWFIASEPAVAWARGENTMADNSDSPNTGTETETLRQSPHLIRAVSFGLSL